MCKLIFVAYFPLLKEKSKSRDPGISRDGDQFCPVIPGYGKASKILNPNARLCETGQTWRATGLFKYNLLFKSDRNIKTFQSKLSKTGAKNVKIKFFYIFIIHSYW